MSKLMSKEQLEKIKLTSDENARLDRFIANAVRRDIKFTILTERAGVAPIVGIQEVYNSPEDTLGTYEGLLNKQAQGHTTKFNPREPETSKAHHVPGSRDRVLSTDMVVILQLILREKVYNSEVSLRGDTIENLKAKLDTLATPDEQKATLRKQIEELEGATA